MHAIRWWLYPIAWSKTFTNLTIQATKTEVARVLWAEQPDIIQQGKKWWMTVQAKSKYIPMSVQQTDTITAIDSVVELDPQITYKITHKLNELLSQQRFINDTVKHDRTLSLLQHILIEELGSITNISSAEAEQKQAINNSDTWIIKSQQLQQKMCTLRAWYSAQVLNNLWREATTLCGSMGDSWHARNLLKSPSWKHLIFDAMNPQMHQWYPFVNSLDISSSEYNSRLTAKEPRIITMAGHPYSLSLAQAA